MKSRVSMSIFYFAISTWLLFSGLCMGEATVSLKAVAKNAVPISPTSNLQIQPGDVITADVFLSGWNNPPFDGAEGLIHTYQIRIAGVTSALSANACGPCNTGYVAPLGWDAPLEAQSCPCSNPCFPVCHNFFRCVGPSWNPSQMAQIDTTRTDWIFSGLKSFPPVEDVSSVNVRWGGVLLEDGGQMASRCSGGSMDGSGCSIAGDCPGGFCDPNYLSYVGTLNLKAGDAVCGTYTISCEGSGETFIANNAPPPSGTVTPVLQNLTLTTGLPCTDTLSACCTESPTFAFCEMTCEAECMGSNQRYGGPGSTCDVLDPPCELPRGACCIAGTCHAGSICHENVHKTDCQHDWRGAGSTCSTLDPPCTSFCTIVTSPPNCSTDARRPYPPNQPTGREGFTSWEWRFPGPLGSGENAPNDFSLRQVPSITPPVPPTISSVTWGANRTITLRLSAPIQPGHWTCVKHNASGIEKCLGYLPGDVDANRTVGVADLMKTIDNLNGVVHPPLSLDQCDIDRSGVCRPGDLLTEIDLLNGASGFPSQNGKVLEPCPSP